MEVDMQAYISKLWSMPLPVVKRFKWLAYLVEIITNAHPNLKRASGHDKHQITTLPVITWERQF